MPSRSGPDIPAGVLENVVRTVLEFGITATSKTNSSLRVRLIRYHHRMLVAYEIGAACPRCLCVQPSPVSWCRAASQLVRPDEVGHLLTARPRRLGRPVPLGENIAAWFRGKLLAGELAYVPDPESCDRWCGPATTLELGTGDCDDLAILAASLIQAAGGSCVLIIGRLCTSEGCDGHAWVEGFDSKGHFLLEATSGALYRGRPAAYQPLVVSDGVRCVAHRLAA